MPSDIRRSRYPLRPVEDVLGLGPGLHPLQDAGMTREAEAIRGRPPAAAEAMFPEINASCIILGIGNPAKQEPFLSPRCIIDMSSLFFGLFSGVLMVWCKG